MADQMVEIEGRRLKLSNLSKVLYPGTGFTKGEVLDYYVRVAPVLLTHLGDRGLTFRRAPDGVDGQIFFTKRCPEWAPEWIDTARSSAEASEEIDYCMLSTVAALTWAANLAALELHAPLARADDPDTPTMVVFDLDPGEPAGMADCCQVALLLRESLAPLGLELFPKTSGNKGLQVYLPLNPAPGEGMSFRETSAFAHTVADLLAKHHPKLVVARMTKSIRAGRVFIDWSQNSRHKTTIGAYSLRIKSDHTVSTPVTWDEVELGADGQLLRFEATEVLERITDIGDVFAPAATLTQALPQ